MGSSLKGQWSPSRQALDLGGSPQTLLPDHRPAGVLHHPQSTLVNVDPPTVGVVSPFATKRSPSRVPFHKGAFVFGKAYLSGTSLRNRSDFTTGGTRLYFRFPPRVGARRTTPDPRDCPTLSRVLQYRPDPQDPTGPSQGTFSTRVRPEPPTQPTPTPLRKIRRTVDVLVSSAEAPLSPRPKVSEFLGRPRHRSPLGPSSLAEGKDPFVPHLRVSSKRVVPVSSVCRFRSVAPLVGALRVRPSRPLRV